MELTLDQAREIASLRRRWPGADALVHRRANDLIVELRHHGRTVALARFGADGSVGAQRRVAA